MNRFATHRSANSDWAATDAQGVTQTWERANTVVLMDIRAELQKLNAVFECQNFLDIPQLLREIKANTRKPRKRKAARHVR